MLRAKFIILFLLLITPLFSIAETEMADKLRDDGKIYVVIVVIATIFAGILVYLVKIDRKISKLEKGKNNIHSQIQK